MRVVGFGSASSRRIAIFGLAACLSAASVGAQTPPAGGAQAPADGQQPASGQAAGQPAQQQQDAFKFTSDSAVIIWQIKPEATADFESVWNVIRGRALGATDKPDAKAIVESMKLYKHVAPPGTTGPVSYFFQIDPVVSTATYDPSYLLFMSGLFERPEADELFNKLSAAINPPGINPIPLQKMPAPAPMAAPPPSAAPPAGAPPAGAPPAGGSTPPAGGGQQ